jgi:hypothetical protein
MGRSLVRPIFLVLAGLYATTLHAQDAITVDVNATLADVARRPIGINLNFLLDDDGNRPAAINTLAQALRMAGVKYLRYPGGEKADGYLWSVPPYTSSIPTLARWAPGEWPTNTEWPSYDRALVNPDGFTFRTNPLSFDEFMEICRQIDCVPTIVVCYDSIYKPPQPGGFAPSRSTVLQAAREWVRYANVTRGYKVQYWEIGNETWQPHYNGQATASDYARDLVEFSRAMKGVDPTIKIGANGESLDWWQTVLAGAAPSIDFLAVHNYPPYEWGSYSYYQNNSPRMLDVVETAWTAIASYAPDADRARLKVAVTEANAADWSGAWPNDNDIGHALVVFDMLGKHLTTQVEFTQLWNTRWSGGDSAPIPRLIDTFDGNNNLQATGSALAIWGQFLKEKMVASTSAGMVRTYSTYSPGGRTATVFLINKDTRARDVTVRLENLSSSFSARRWVFKGTGPDDARPSWSGNGVVQSAGNLISATLDPVSVTVLDLTPGLDATVVPGIIEAEDFVAFWDSTPGNEGGQYRATDVDVEASSDAGGGFNVGWMDAGEWLEYRIAVQTAGAYRILCRVASPFGGTTLRVAIDGNPIGNVINVPNTGSWQTWQSVPTSPVDLSPGIHTLRISTGTGWLNLNKVVIQAAQSQSSLAIEAEDFDAFWDTTQENEGGHYRSTPVDIEPTADAGGGYNVGWIAAGEWLEYSIIVDTSDTYQISCRVASPIDGGTFRVTIDGNPVGDLLAVPNTGSWQTWQSVSTLPVPLSAGTHTLRVSIATGWFNLNKFLIQPWQTSSSLTIEAEDFESFWDSTDENEGGHYRSTGVDIEPTTDAGGGYNVGWMAAGEWLEYAFEVQSGGGFTVDARVASVWSGTTLRLEIDGAPRATLGIPNTGSWQSWQTVQTPAFHLDAGAHRLRVVTDTGGLNLNRLIVQRVSAE